MRKIKKLGRGSEVGGWRGMKKHAWSCVILDRAMQKRAFGHMRTVKAPMRLPVHRDAQSDQGLHYPLADSLDTTEYMNRE